MSGPFGLIKSAIPILNQPVILVQHYHTFIVQCGCEAGTVSVIIGNGPGVPCPACGCVPAAVMEGEVKLGMGRPRAVTEN